MLPVIWLALIGAIYSRIAPFFAWNRIFFPANEEATLKTKQPIRFQGLFKETNQISGKWKTSIMWQILQLLFPKLLFPPPPRKKWMNLISNRLSTASIKIIVLTKIPAFGWFRNGCNKVVIEPRVVQFWSEIILVITNGSRAARLFDFKISHITHITLTHLSCSPNFPHALYLDERTLTYEPIVNYLALSSISSISFLSFFLLLSRFWSFRYQHLVNFTNDLTNETSNS